MCCRFEENFFLLLFNCWKRVELSLWSCNSLFCTRRPFFSAALLVVTLSVLVLGLGRRCVLRSAPRSSSPRAARSPFAAGLGGRARAEELLLLPLWSGVAARVLSGVGSAVLSAIWQSTPVLPGCPVS